MSGFLVAQQTRIQVMTPKIEQLPGLKLNVDAMDSGSMFQESARLTRAGIGDPVGGVLQPSGNHASQTVTAAKPTRAIGWNGLPVLSFDGGDYLICDWLAASAGVSGSDKPFTVVAVLKFSAVGAIRQILTFGRAATNNTLRMCGVSSFPAWFFYSVDDADGENGSTGGTPDTSPHVVCFLFSGMTVSILIDGVTVANETVHNLGVNTLDQATIGAQRTFGALTQFMLGVIGQLAVLNRRISNDEAKFATHLFGAKWGIVTL